MSAVPASLAVLMYHAIATDTARDGGDDHYSVSPAAFSRHLALMREMGLRPASVRDVLAGNASGAGVALTFDDGHASNLAAAREILEASGSAELFVNATNVGRANFLDWGALRDLAQAGISIQSHGNTHRYFDELPEREVEEELRVSKREIEDRTGHPVTLFAPPAGRLTPRVAAIAREAGYQAICSSHAGVWHTGSTLWRIPRLAVLASTGEATLRSWIAQDPLVIARLRLRDGILAGAKRVLGNRRYVQLRARLLGQGETEPGAR